MCSSKLLWVQYAARLDATAVNVYGSSGGKANSHLGRSKEMLSAGDPGQLESTWVPVTAQAGELRTAALENPTPARKEGLGRKRDWERGALEELGTRE